MSLDTDWYIIQTKPKREENVRRLLSQAKFELFYPQIKHLTAPKPLFPSYLFIRADLKNPHIHRLILYTRGIKKILGGGEGPQPLADIFVETLKGRLINRSLTLQELLFKEGDLVRVKRGILKDLDGIIEKNVPEDGRVRVLFKWLYTNFRASLKFTDLEKAA